MPKGVRKSKVVLTLDENDEIVPPPGYISIKEIIERGLIPKAQRMIQYACKKYYDRVLQARRDGVKGHAYEEPQRDELKCIRVVALQGPMYFVEEDSIAKHHVHRGGVGSGRGRRAGSSNSRKRTGGLPDGAERLVYPSDSGSGVAVAD